MRLVLTPPYMVVCPRILLHGTNPWGRHMWRDEVGHEVFHEGGLSCEGDSHSRLCIV